MSNIKRRLTALEMAGSRGAVTWRRIIQQSDQTLDEALDAYGRDRIAPTDRLIVRNIVDPVIQAGGGSE